LIFSLFGAAVLVLLSILYTINRKKIKADKIFIGITSIALTGMLVTILVAISFGLSTRTSEGDRLLYFPSVFYSILMAVVIVRLSPSLFAAIIFFILLSGFQVYFLSLNQNNWIRASEYSNKIIRGISSQSLRPIYIVNLPMDYKGAFVFRNCLEEALLNNNIDTTGIKIVNVLESAKADQKGSLIVPEEKDGNIFIWPEVSISAINDSTYEVKDNNRRQSVTKDDPVLFWDKEDLRLLRK
jgi:hypothetical protein